MTPGYFTPQFQLLNLSRRLRGTKSQFVRSCPICGHVGRFGVQMLPILVDSICPKCKSSGRHRQFYSLIQSGKLKLDEPIIHFAAESCLSQLFQMEFNQYSRVGLQGPDLVLNIEKICLNSESVSTVIAHQVLEHVDDVKALSEIWRILRRGGVFCFSTPVVDNWSTTLEDLQVSDEDSRLLFFGQKDHVRFYGRDLLERVKRVGFTIQEFVATEPEVSTFGLQRGESIFVCLKD